MRLVALVDSPDHVCCRYRLAAFRRHFADARYDLELVPLPRGWIARLRLFASLRSADAVILQRRLLPGWQFAALRRAARKLIFDFDDAVWLRDSYHPRGLLSRSRLKRFARTCAAADVVVAGNSFLTAAAGRGVVIPTCVEPADYPLARHDSHGGLRLVWVGSSSTLQGLDRDRDKLEAVGRAVTGARLKLVCDRFLTFADLPTDNVPWSAATEAAEIAAADVGVAVVPDDDWSRGKCGLKVLQYMAAGLPVIANPVGVHAELVTHGETGFLAETPAEWAGAARRLAADPELRKRMGAAGRARVTAEYSVAAGGRKWAGLLAGLANTYRRVG